MAAPTVIAPGIPDVTIERNKALSINTSVHFDDVGAPAIDYELVFDATREMANFAHPCTFKAKFAGNEPTFNDCLIGSTGNFQMRHSSTQLLRVDFPDGLGGIDVIQSNNIYPKDGTEYEFEVRFTSGRVELWVDGVLDRGLNKANDPTDFNINWLGRMNAGANDINGVLKDVDLNGVAFYAINDGPGASVIEDSVGSADATPVNIISTDWQENL
jgi:hypothetical protein